MATFDGDALRSPRAGCGDDLPDIFSGVLDGDGALGDLGALQRSLANTVQETQDEKWALRYVAAGKLWGEALARAFEAAGDREAWFEALEEPQKDYLERRQASRDGAEARHRAAERSRLGGHHVYGACDVAPAREVGAAARTATLAANAAALLDGARWPRLGASGRFGKLLGDGASLPHALPAARARPGAAAAGATLWSAGRCDVVLVDEDPRDRDRGERIVGCVFAGFADARLRCAGCLHLASARDRDPTFVSAQKACFVAGCGGAVVLDDTVLDGGYERLMPGEGADSRRVVAHGCRGHLVRAVVADHLDVLEHRDALDTADEVNVLSAAQDGRVSCYACEHGHVWGRAYVVKSRVRGNYMTSAPE